MHLSQADDLIELFNKTQKGMLQNNKVHIRMEKTGTSSTESIVWQQEVSHPLTGVSLFEIVYSRPAQGLQDTSWEIWEQEATPHNIVILLRCKAV